MDIAQLSATIVTAIAPFTPYLIEGGKAFAGEIGKTTWQEAQNLFKKIETIWVKDKKLKQATLLLATDPEDLELQKIVTIALGIHLKEKPELVQEFLELLKEPSSIQLVIAERKSWLEDIMQELQGRGNQTIKADQESVIKGVKQVKK